LVGWYLYETHKMRRAAEDQIEKSQALVVAAQDPLEHQRRPALILKMEGWELTLWNIGNGPAINVTLALTETGRALDFPIAPLRDFKVPFVENGVPVPLVSLAPELRKNIEECFGLQCKYESLSGRIYYSIVAFNREGPTTTRFVPTPEIRQ
jgi:hypothetical protein